MQRTRAKGGSDRGAGDDKDREVDAYDYSSRVSAHRPMAEYSLWHCLCYSFYAPQYLAGPTITFNAFLSHVSMARSRPRYVPFWPGDTSVRFRVSIALGATVSKPTVAPTSGGCRCCNSFVLKARTTVYSLPGAGGFAAAGPSEPHLR